MGVMSITDTPLWRNGPPEKPVLCNACGSRYRLRGHLQQYIPKHLGFRSRKLKTVADDKAIDDLHHHYVNLEDIVPSNDILQMARVALPTGRKECHRNPSEHSKPYILCSKGGFIDTSLWKSQIPSRKRSQLVYRHQTHIERFQRRLLRLLKYEGLSNQSSSPSDGELLYDPNLNPCRPCNEIGLGVVLLEEEKLLHIVKDN